MIELMMEKDKIKLIHLNMSMDNATRKLIIVDLFLLISIVSGGVIHAFLSDYILVQSAIIAGFIVGFIAMFYLVKFYKIISKHFPIDDGGLK